MRDIQRTISNANTRVSPWWLLPQRDSLFYPSELAQHTIQGSPIQLPTPSLEICGHATRGRTRKTVIKIDEAKRTLETMFKGLTSYTVQNIEGTPKPNRASIRIKNIHPSAHSQAVMAGLIHLPIWKTVHKILPSGNGHTCRKSDAWHCTYVPTPSHGSELTYSGSYINKSKYSKNIKRKYRKTEEGFPWTNVPPKPLHQTKMPLLPKAKKRGMQTICHCKCETLRNGTVPRNI